MAEFTPIPFKEIADRALSCAESLLRAWLPDGKKQGGEWSATNPLRADNKRGSFNINLRSGKWGDFATADAGNDLISLYAYLNGLEQWEAAIEVADQIGFKLPDGCRRETTRERKTPVVDPETIKEKKKEESPWLPVTPVPTNAPEAPRAHKYRGLPAAQWAYKDQNGQLLGYVYRFNKSDGGKEHVPLVYCKHKDTEALDWQFKQWQEPNRPLYGLDRLANAPEAYVLLVEGEKCADAAQALIKGAVVTWPGGSKAVDKCDFSPLAGRKIYAWADCDAQREPLSKDEKTAGVLPDSKPLLPEHEQPGMKAMLRIREKVLEIDPSTEFLIVDIPKPLEKPSGWDVADAIAEGMTAEALLAFMRKIRPNLALVVDNPENEKSISTAFEAGAEEDDSGGLKYPRGEDWYQYLLEKNHSIVPCLANVVDILENDKRWSGVIAFDEFAHRVVKLKKPPYWNGAGQAGEWDAQDDARTAMWITKMYRFSPNANLVAEAIEVVARSNVVNPPKEWLESLVWDGNHRLDNWMKDFMGVPATDYTMRVARWFFMGMVKRVFEPGCKFDYCLVLEGPQGRRKSTALAVIGGEWYGDTDLDLHNKDSMSALRGKMLYEFSEMGSVAKAEATKQKSFLSRQVDEYRPVYGRREIRAPRQVVFSGTTNEWEWNKDATGGRRFWPIEVQEEIDIEGLKLIRDQLFAEAVQFVKRGRRYWPDPQEQKEYFDKEQLKRSIPDSLLDGLYQNVNEQVGEFSLFYAATEWLKLSARDLTPAMNTRIGIALRQLGCTKVERRTDPNRFLYKPPERKDASSNAAQMKGLDDDDINF